MAVDSGHVAFCFFLCNFSFFLGNYLMSFLMNRIMIFSGLFLNVVAFFFLLYCIKTTFGVGMIQFENDYRKTSGLFNCAIVLLEVFYLGWFIISIIKDFRFI